MSHATSLRTPSFRRHKASNQGCVEIDGRQIYLGRFDLPEMRQRYHQTIQEWIANGYRLPVPPDEVTVVELCAAYWDYAKIQHRKPNGSPTSELPNVRRAIRELRELYGATPVAEFGPLKLKAIRNRLVSAGLCRKTVNRRANTIRRIVKWGVSEAVVPVNIFTALQTVEGLKAERGAEVKVTEPIKPVPQSHVEAVKPHVSRQVAALIDLQLFAGARAGELLKLRPIDFDTSRDIWAVSLRDHKTSHQCKKRIIYFGPRAQAVVRSCIENLEVTAYLFSPREAEKERY